LVVTGREESIEGCTYVFSFLSEEGEGIEAERRKKKKQNRNCQCSQKLPPDLVFLCRPPSYVPASSVDAQLNSIIVHVVFV